MREETLQASLRPLTGAIDLAITIVDLSGIVLEWNPAAERMYGIPREQIIGRDITGFFSPASLMVRRVLETGQPVESTYHQPRPGIHVLITATPITKDGRLVGALAVERDVSRMVQLSSDLIAARDQVAALKHQLAGQVPPQPEADQPFKAIRGRNPVLLHAIELARRIAPTEAIALIRGESGVGKELFAQGIHRASKRSKGPFVALNCGAIPPALFESDLFGYAPGAFTGANPRGQAGKLEMAQGGTLFLDEVGDLPLESQVKLLRFLEDRRFFRVGGNTPLTADVRILAATNRPLEKMVEQGTFREDLYWRLNVVSLTLPPLRERRDDIPDLVELYIQEFSIRHGRQIERVDPRVIQALMAHPWPGNVRELRNTVERLVVLAWDGVIGPDLLPDALRPPLPAKPAPPAPAPAAAVEPAAKSSLQESLAMAERAQILAVLEQVRGNRKEAARLLGISRGTLYYKMKRLGIAPWQNESPPPVTAEGTGMQGLSGRSTSRTRPAAGGSPGPQSPLP